ncbi:MAG: hypothetical protein OXG53_07575 [Chloroflexi bacterium]|nr:hypothetical protein [Chloroflexota bacterium]
MSRIAAALRQHWPFFLFVPLLTLVMTWPTAAYVFDGNTMWLPSKDLDLGMKMWDAWYGGQILAGNADFYFTDRLFYPQGLSLVFHNFSIPHMLLMLGAQSLLPATNAFNLVFMLIVFSNAAASYIYLFHLFSDRWLSLFGSVVFGLSVFVLRHPTHPGLNTVAAIPLVMYGLQRGLDEGRHRWILLAGALIGITAFTGMYIFVCLVISVGVFLLFQFPKQWKARGFWASIMLLLVVAGAISALRIYPMLREGAALDEALYKGGGREFGSDLLDHFVHRENRITEHIFASVLREPVPPLRGDGYLGYVTLILAAIALLKAKPRRTTLFWFFLFLTFFVLKLGPALVIKGHTYAEIILPKHHLNVWFPTVFKAFWITAYFHAGLLLPLATLAVLGLRRLRDALPVKIGGIVILACLTLNLLETIKPLPAYIVPAQQLHFMDWLRSEDKQDAIRLINVPFGRGPSKRYALYHAFSGYPHAEGLASRTPSAAYAYIRENTLLAAWRNEKGIMCLPFNEGAFKHALDQLLADGFSHAVFHNDFIRPVQFEYYSVMSIHPAYEDQYAKVYRLRDMHGACEDSALFGSNVLPELADIMEFSAMASDLNARDLSDLPNDEARLDNDGFASSSAGAQPLALKLSANGIVLGAPITLANAPVGDQLLPDDGLAVIAFYPVHLETDVVEAAASRLALELKSCGRIEKPGAAAIEYFTRAEVPCALLISDDPFAVSYENGVFLANVLLNGSGEELETYLLWNKLPEVAHGLSIQLFDRDGAKIAGSDFTIRHDWLSRHRLDLRPLDPGEYTVKLILYHFETRASVAGVAVNAQSRFVRELEIGSITIG